MTPNQMSALRALVRAVLVCVTAFGLELSAPQVAAVQLVAEAVLNVPVQWKASKATNDPQEG